MLQRGPWKRQSPLCLNSSRGHQPHKRRSPGAAVASWLAALDLAVGVCALAIAAVVYIAAPRQWANRLMALLLLVDGLGWFGIAAAAAGFFPGLPGTQAVQRVTLAASPWLYAAFVATALDVPLTRPLRGRRAQAALLALAVAVPAVLLLFLDRMAGYQRVAEAVGVISGPYLVVATWALFAAVQGFRRMSNPRKGVAYVAAFGLRDLALILLFGAALVAKQVPGWQWFGPALAAVKTLLLGHLLYLAYGLLSGQVMDLDDRVRATIQKGIVLTVVAAVFLVATEGTEMFVGVESPALAIAAAGAITLLFQPLHRGAERLARRILPALEELPGVPRKQRLAMYRDQVEAAWADGRLGAKERQMLQQLREKLGILPEEAERIEAERRPAKKAGS